MCDDCPPPLERLHDWLSDIIGDLAAERARQVKAAKREVARLARQVEGIMAPVDRIRDGLDRIERQIFRIEDKLDRVPQGSREARRLKQLLDATKSKRYPLRERLGEAYGVAEEKIVGVDVHGVLVNLREAYGISLPPGYSLRLTAGELEVLDERNLGFRLSTDVFASPARLALALGTVLELRASQPWRGPSPGSSLSALEMYDYQLRNAQRFGLGRDMVRDIKARRSAEYEELPEDYQRRVDIGDYELTSGEYSEPPPERPPTEAGTSEPGTGP